MGHSDVTFNFITSVKSSALCLNDDCATSVSKHLYSEKDLKQNKTKRNIYTESSSATSVPLQRLKLDTGTLNVIYENVKGTQNKKNQTPTSPTEREEEIQICTRAFMTTMGSP